MESAFYYVFHTFQILMNVRWRFHVTTMLTASTLLGPSVVPAMKDTVGMVLIAQVSTFALCSLLELCQLRGTEVLLRNNARLLLL